MVIFYSQSGLKQNESLLQYEMRLKIDQDRFMMGDENLFMKLEELVSIDPLAAFLAGTHLMAFSGNSINNLPNLTSQINRRVVVAYSGAS